MQNVVIVCLDSVRKDVYDKKMERVQEKVDISLDGCRSPSSWSVPSHASFLTGQLPSEHGVHSYNLDFGSLDTEHVFTNGPPWEKSASISANQFTNGEFNFDKWFDECQTLGSTAYFPAGLSVRNTDDAIDHLRESMNHPHKIRSILNGAVSAFIKTSNELPIKNPFDNGASSIRRTSRRTIEDSDEPFLLFTNFMEGHHPHQPNLNYDNITDVPASWSSESTDLMDLNKSDHMDRKDEFLSNFRSIYHSAVGYLDTQIFEFIESIQNVANNNTTFIITADHGENLGHQDDDRLIGHTASLSEGLLHVPFDIVNPPSELNFDKSQIFSLRELPHIVGMIANGQSISIADKRYTEAELIGGGLLDDLEDYWDRMIRAVYDSETETKVVWDSLGNVFQYEVGNQSSSRENKNSIDEIPSWATNRFETEIEEYKNQFRNESTDLRDIQEGTKERLGDLGYL